MNAELLHVLPPEADRRLFLGGSDAAAIMGVGATYRGETQTAYTVWSKKTSVEPEKLDAATQKFFRNRKRYEIPIMDALQEEFAAEIVAKNKRYRDPALDFLAAEIDFEWRDPADGSTQNGEIKTVHPLAFGEKFGWGEPMTDEIPVHYAAQVMHGLGVTGRRTAIVVAAIGFDTMNFYQVTRNDETVASMRERMRQFWAENVIARVPPSPQTMEDIKAMYARVNGRPVEIDEATAEKLQQLRALRASLKAFEEEKAEIEFAIASFVCKQWGIEDANAKADDAVLNLNGAPVATWKRQRGTHLDQKGLKEAHPTIVQQFTREHFFRPIRFK